MSNTVIEIGESQTKREGSYCPCCGSLVDSRDVYLDTQSGAISLGENSAVLNNQQTILFIQMLRAWPRAVTTDTLLMALYAEREEPETALKVLHNVIKLMRPLIEPLGLRVNHRNGVGYKLSIPSHASVSKLSVNRRAA